MYHCKNTNSKHFSVVSHSGIHALQYVTLCSIKIVHRSSDRNNFRICACRTFISYNASTLSGITMEVFCFFDRLPGRMSTILRFLASCFFKFFFILLRIFTSGCVTAWNTTIQIQSWLVR